MAALLLSGMKDAGAIVLSTYRKRRYMMSRRKLFENRMRSVMG